jgi:hypothetical protein
MSIMGSPCSCKDSRYDDNGLMKAPAMFWAAMLLLTRPWWLGVLAVMSTPAAYTAPGTVWPDIKLQVIALTAGIPCMAMLFVYPVRGQWPILTRMVWGLILVALVAMLMADLEGMMSDVFGWWSVGGVFLGLDVACVIMLWPDRRMRAVFLQAEKQP